MREHHVWMQREQRNVGYKRGGDVFKQPGQEQLESCGGASCSKGGREVHGHHVPLWDLWTLDAGCYLLLGWTETYCWELPTPPHASALCSRSTAATWEPRSLQNKRKRGAQKELFFISSEHRVISEIAACDFDRLKISPSCLQRVCPTLSHAPPSNSSSGISLCLLETTDVTSWD